MGKITQPEWIDRLKNAVQDCFPDMSEQAVRYRCVECGKVTTGRKDETARYPRKHKRTNGSRCPGSFLEAEQVEVPVRGKHVEIAKEIHPAGQSKADRVH